MGEVKRWSVTYTKHIKQKRKVYQDGFLELHSSSHKVMLYDDCEKLLDSRFEKKDEVISSGETIAFNSYLVDIGDPHGDDKSIPNLDFQGKDKNINGKSGSLHRNSFRSSFVSSGNIKANFGEKKAPSSSLSQSQRIIREFKKSEMSKYSTSPSCPDTTKSKTVEWQVVYTTHITQKAKKFHDGFLQLVLCGSQGRQVSQGEPLVSEACDVHHRVCNACVMEIIMLYDATRQLLNSRFLKRDEVIKSGESLAFDGHLVDVGECEGENEPLKDLNVQERNRSVVGKTEMIPNHIRTESPVEWDVMYTTQITQKAKKYNCGILRVAPCGSYRMQATLVSEDGNTLGHNFLKLSEDVRTGNTLRFPHYLVEVGEPRTSSKGEQQNSACSGKNVDLNVKNTPLGNAKFGRKIHEDKAAHNGKPQDDASPRNIMSNTRSSTMDCNAPSSRPTNTSIRAAHEILSFIKKPMIPEEIVTVESTSEKQRRSAEALDSVHYDFKNAEEEPLRNFNHKRDVVMHLDEETMKKHNHSYGTSQSKADDEVCCEIVNLVDSQNRAECQADDISLAESTTQCLDSSETRPTSPMMEPQDIVPPKSDSMGLPQIVSVLCDRSKTYKEDGSSTDQKHLVADSTCPSFDSNNGEKLTGTPPAATYCLGSIQSSKEVKLENIPLHYADNSGIDKRCNEVSGGGIIVPNGYTKHGPFVIEEKNSRQAMTTRKLDEFPSFDLGF